MKSSSKKSAIKWLLGGFTAFTLTISLAGCSQTAEESPELEKTTDASLTETAEYVPASADGPAQNVPEPRLPISATERSEEGALETLNYFWEAAQYLRLTGEAKPLSLISSETCDFCTTFMDDWQNNYDSGYWAAPDGEVEVSVTASWAGEEEEVNLNSVDVLFSISEPEITVYDADGQEQESASDEGSENVTEWLAILSFDATVQQWNVEWIGLEELVTWEE